MKLHNNRFEKDCYVGACAASAHRSKQLATNDKPRRFDGYNYFGKHPELMSEWFDSHIS